MSASCQINSNWSKPHKRKNGTHDNIDVCVVSKMSAVYTTGFSLVPDETDGGAGCFSVVSGNRNFLREEASQQFNSPQAANNMCMWTWSMTFGNIFIMLPVIVCPLRFDLTSEIIFASRAALPPVCSLKPQFVLANVSLSLQNLF